MSALGELAANSGGALTGQLWKVAAIVLAILLLAGGGAGGALWWAAAGDRDQALTELAAERRTTAELRAGIDTQNRAITQWYEQARAAEARGAAERQAAEASRRRYDQALAQLAGARPTTCDEAMPYVNKLLESVR